MLQSEFDRLTSRPYTEAEFSEIHSGNSRNYRLK